MLAIMKTIKYILLIFLFTGTIHCTKESASNAGGQSGAGGSTARFTISGNFLYVVDHLSIKSFDISNPNAPVYKSHTEVGLNIETIFPYQDKLFIGSSSSMYIYTLTNPAKPALLGHADYVARGACDPVIARDNVSYSTLRGTGPCGGGGSALVVYDISNLTSPVLRNTFPLFEPYGLGLKDNALYVCDGRSILVFNVTNRFDPVLERRIEVPNAQFFDVIPYGNILIAQVNDGFILYDIGNDPLQPAYLSRILN
jgi:hypothetical protein